MDVPKTHNGAEVMQRDTQADFSVTRERLNHIGLANQTQCVVPERQGPLHTHALAGFDTGLIRFSMHCLTIGTMACCLF